VGGCDSHPQGCDENRRDREHQRGDGPQPLSPGLLHIPFTGGDDLSRDAALITRMG